MKDPTVEQLLRRIEELEARERTHLDVQERLRTLISSMPDIVCFKDGQGRWIEANEFDLKLFQLEGVDYRGKKDSELASYSPFYYDAFMNCEDTDEEAWRRAEMSRKDEVIPRPDGADQIFDVMKVPIFNGDGSRKGLVIVGRDITERRKAEEQRVLLAHAIDQGSDIILITDKEFVIQYVTSAITPIAGYSKEEVVGEPLTFLSGEGGAALFAEPMKSVARGNTHRWVFTTKAKSGREFTVEATLSPVRSGDTSVNAYVMVMRDITEKLDMEEQLRQTQKVEGIGRLAGGIAHDFNNLLSPILGYAGILKEENPDEPHFQEYLSEITSASMKAKELVRQLLAFSSKQELCKEPINLNDTIIEFGGLLRRTIREDVEIETHFSQVKPVMADERQMEQVLLNLMVNASDAMPEGGKVTITTGLSGGMVVEKDQELSTPGNYVRVSIKDTGVGMDPAVRANIFEPFFTTKGENGTGLGLSTVYGIITQHNGHIRVKSQPGQGSEFLIYLPVHEGEVAAREADVPHAMSGGAGTILVTEDDIKVLQLAKTVLVRYGYEVLAARGSEEALELLATYGDQIDLLLTDVVMPGKNGVALAREVKRRIPHVRVLFMSGYTEDAFADFSSPNHHFPILAKPFTIESLLTSVSQALSAPQVR